MASKPQHKDRKYKDLSMKQKTRIAEKTYSKYLRFFLENSRMPDANEATIIHKKLFESVRSLAPLADFESFDVLCNKRAETYEARVHGVRHQFPISHYKGTIIIMEYHLTSVV